MATMSTIEELENELLQLRVRTFKSEVRLEALIRLLMAKGSFNVDEYQAAVTSFQVLNNALSQINTINSIMDKVNAANEFNKTSMIKIQGDDLGLKKIIEDAGGTSDFTARLVLSKLPCSTNFSDFMKQFIDTTKNPSPEALTPEVV